MRLKLLFRVGGVTILAAGLWSGWAFVTVAQAPDAARVLRDRAALLAADDGCRLLAPDARAGLEAGALQAKSALLRAGKGGEAALIETEGRAIGRTKNCSDPGLLAEAARAEDSLKSLLRRPFLSFPGRVRTWMIARYPNQSQWRMWQDSVDGGRKAQFGLAGEDKSVKLTLDVHLMPAETGFGGARLYLRDAALAPDAFLPLGSGLRPAPRSAVQAFWASDRVAPPPAQKPKKGAKAAPARIMRFSFSEAALKRMAELDPRESVEIELDPPKLARNSPPVRLNFEIGDFAPARTFALLPTPLLVEAKPPAPRPAPPGGR